MLAAAVKGEGDAAAGRAGRNARGVVLAVVFHDGSDHRAFEADLDSAQQHQGSSPGEHTAVEDAAEIFRRIRNRHWGSEAF